MLVRQGTSPGRWTSYLVPLSLCAVLQGRQSEEGHNVEDMVGEGGTGKVTVMVTAMAGFSVGVWLVTFWRSGFRSDCYL